MTRMLHAGVPLVVASTRIGHSTPVTTLRFYSHELPLEDQGAADLLAGIYDNWTSAEA